MNPMRLRQTLQMVAAALLVGGLLLLLRVEGERPRPAEPGPSPSPGAEWTADARQEVLTTVLLGALPPPTKDQLRPPCDPDIHVELNGACWIPLALPRCPEGKAFSHEGRCYARAFKAARAPLPSSGEPRGQPVADP